MGQLSKFLPALGAGVLIYAVVTFLFALFMRSGYVSASWIQVVRMTALSAAALAAGKLSGATGKKGVLIGAGFALIWLVWKVCVNSSTATTANTISEMALCILFSWVGSCIFHKKKHGYTKRNRRIASAR